MLTDCAPGPWPSSRLSSVVGADEHASDPTLGEYIVETVDVSPSAAPGVLRTLAGRRGDDGIEAGHSVRFWSATARFTLDLLMDQRFLPTLLQVDRQHLAARWTPWLHDDEVVHRFTLLSESMPPVARANGGDGRAQTVDVVGGDACDVDASRSNDVDGVFRTQSFDMLWRQPGKGEHAALTGDEGEVPDESYIIPFGEANITREGNDVTIIGMGKTTNLANDAADQLAKEKISCNVIDLRTLSPLDEDTIIELVEDTGKVVIVDESSPRCNIGTDISALIVQNAFKALKAPIQIVSPPHTPVPFAPELEDAYMPNAGKIVKAVKEICNI